MPEHVLLVGSGPSGEGQSLTSVTKIVGPISRLTRFNHFYVGTNFGTDFDDVVFSANDPTLLTTMYSVLCSEQRTVRRFLTPLSKTALGPLTFLQIDIENFWKYLPEDDYFASIYLRGSRQKLPTSGLQAMHFYLTQGVDRFTVVGIDFYSSSVRYAHAQEVSERKLGHYKLNGYEAKAHTRQDDMNYFLHLSKNYQFEVNVLSSPAAWAEFEAMSSRLGATGARLVFPKTEIRT